jgi:hypothetical protein
MTPWPLANANKGPGCLGPGPLSHLGMEPGELTVPTRPT